MYSTLLVDLGGTVLHYRGFLEKASTEISRVFGVVRSYVLNLLHLTWREVKQRIRQGTYVGLRRTLTQVLREYCPPQWAAHVTLMVDTILNSMVECSQLYEEVPEVFTKLQDTGIQIIAVTNIDHDVAEIILEKLSIRHHFTGLVAPENGVAKPYLYPRAVEKYSLDPRTTLVVGDGVEDLVGAKLVGADSLLVIRGGDPLPWGDLRPTYVVRDLRPLPEVVLRGTQS